MREPHEGFKKAIKLMSEQTTTLQREFGHIVTKKHLIANSINYPKNPKETAEVRQHTKALLEGSLLVYLFAMWEEHMPENWREWLTEEERRQMNAYAHVRNCAAHGYKGTRANQRREEFEEQMPFDGIKWDKDADTIDISDSSVAINCVRFMSDLCKQVVIRLHSDQKPK